jgi:RNA polymerase sigma-70 factor (ECF subfamily)
VDEQDKQERFEGVVMPHLDAAYNLARWLTRNEHDAEDVVQDAFLRAFRFFDGFRGGNGKAWLLSIVRNTCYSWLEQNRRYELATDLDDEQLADSQEDGAHPDLLLIKGEDQQLVREALEQLPPEFREVMILRELEELSYKEIAAVTQVPMGTVMSRLARARHELQRVLTERLQEKGAK